MSLQLSLDFDIEIGDQGNGVALSAAATDPAVFAQPPVLAAQAAGPVASPEGTRPSPATLAEILERLDALNGLSPARRRDLASALRGVARILDRGLTDILSKPRALRRQLETFHPASIGMSTKRFANLRADLSLALKLTGCVAQRQGRHAPLNTTWQEASDLCPTPKLRWQLSRFMHWCSARHLLSEAIGMPELESCLVELDQTSLTIEPGRLRRQIVYAWNRCCALVPNWPGHRLELPRVERRWTWPWEAFTDAFRADVECWLHRLAGTHLLDDDGPARPLRAATLKNRRKQLQIAASALVRSGAPVSQIRAIADLVEPTAFKAAISWLIGHYGGPRESLHQLAVVLKAAARHHVKLPEEQLRQLGRYCRRLAVPRDGLTARNRARLRPFRDEERMDRLLTLPQKLMRRALRDRARPCAVYDAQVAVAVEILLMSPIRIGNLVSLQLGRHLRLVGGDGASLSLEPAETKNSVAVDYPLPAETARLIRTYVTDFLPCLGKPGATALFPGREGGAKGQSTLRQQIKAAIRNATGCEVNPHLMRHLGSLRHLEDHPGEYETVRRMLGHKRLETTTAFYTGGETAAAARHFDASLLARRRAAERRLGLPWGDR